MLKKNSEIITWLKLNVQCIEFSSRSQKCFAEKLSVHQKVKPNKVSAITVIFVPTCEIPCYIVNYITEIRKDQ